MLPFPGLDCALTTVCRVVLFLCRGCALALQIEAALDSLCDSAFAGLDTGPAQVDCGKIPHMPPVSLTIAGKQFSLKPEQYILMVSM